MRIVVAAVSITVLYTLFISTSVPFGHASSIDKMASSVKRTTDDSPHPAAAHPNPVNAKAARHVANVQVAMESEEQDKSTRGSQPQSTSRAEGKHVQQHVRPATSSIVQAEQQVQHTQPAAVPKPEVKAVHKAVETDSTGHLEKGVNKLIALLPDEMHSKELLRPITSTGEERLHDLGLRIRSFKPLFDAWEDLHLVSINGKVSVRDDIVSELRRTYSDAPEASEKLAKLLHGYASFRSFFTRLSVLLFPGFAPYSSDLVGLHSSFHDTGRGIVLTAGDGQAHYLLASIPSFRRLGCNLPIEVMYLGDDDLSEDSRRSLEALPGVITRDLSQMISDDGWTLAGWAAKPYAILMSSFREVIFVDADALFFVNPETLFEDPQYRETGALFFKDRKILPEVRRKFLKAVLPRPLSAQVTQSRFWTGESGHMQESGVVVVDKVAHFIPMLLVTRMNGPDRDGNKDQGKVGTYDLVYGDKETFWLGWELVGDVRYAFHAGEAGIMGTAEVTPSVPVILNPNPGLADSSSGSNNNKDGNQSTTPSPAGRKAAALVPKKPTHTICAPQLLHLDTNGKPLWWNGWIKRDKFAEADAQQDAVFDHYMAEPTGGRDSPWNMGESNICCLSAPEYNEFTAKETEVLKMIWQIVKDSAATKS